MKPIRVLYTIPELCVGGVERRLLALASRLDQARFRPILAPLRPGGALEGEARRLGLEVVPAHRTWRFDPAPALSIRRLVRARRVSVVHSFLFLDNCYARVGAALGGASVRIASLAGVDYAPGSLRHVADRALQPLATCLATSSEWMAAYARRHGLARVPVRVIPNGVDVQRFLPGRDRAAARRALGLPDDAFVVGTAGRLAPEKDQAAFLRAAALVASADSQARFVIAGDGPLRHRLETLSLELGLGERVLFTGWIGRMEEALPAFDAFALSSRCEAFGNVLVEAMACGVPVAAMRVGGVPEIVQHGQTGLLAPPGDPGALAEHLLRLRRDAALGRKLAKEGRRQAEERFSLEAMVSRYEALYLEYLGSNHRSSGARPS